jgi:subtilisin family serine protease
MDIAAGNGSVAGSAPGVAREARLIFVHLRGDDTRPEDNLGDSVRLLEGIRYIIDKVGDSPVVINCSLGRTGGPHDYSLNLTQALDSLLDEAPGRCVVMSAGNYFESGLHASGRVPVAGAVELPWHVVPRHAEFAELEVWYPGSDRFRLDLIDPMGRGVSVVRLGEDSVVRVDGHTIASLYQRMKDPNNGWNQAEVFLWPDAMVGTWRVRLLGESVRDGTYHAWIERDDPASQSRFLPAVTSRGTTTNSICNGRNTISVAAYDSRVPAHPIVPWSSGGPTRDGRGAPVLSGPGAGIRAARSSIVSKGRREMDGLTIKSGTSMAAPHVSGTVALMFEAAAPLRLSARETRDILVSTARRNPPWSVEDQLRYGAGRVDASKATRAACGLGKKGVGS